MTKPQPHAEAGAFRTANPHALATILEAAETRRIIAATDIFALDGTKLWASHQPVSAALQRKLMDRKLRAPLESCLVAGDEPGLSRPSREPSGEARPHPHGPHRPARGHRGGGRLPRERRRGVRHRRHHRRRRRADARMRGLSRHGNTRAPGRMSPSGAPPGALRGGRHGQGDAAGARRPGSRAAGGDRQSAPLPRLDDPLPDHGRLRGALRAPLHELRLRHPRHADDDRPRRGPGGALRRRPHAAALLRALGRDAGADRVPPARRPPADRGHRLPAHAGLLQRGPRALRRGRHLLRPARRGGHRRPHPPVHAGRLPRVTGVPDLRDPGRPGDRGRGPRARRRRDAGQHLGDAAQLPGRSSTASTSRSRR